MGLRIETFGLPGAGKSTLTRACLPMLKDAGWTIVATPALDRIDAKTDGPAPNFWKQDSKRQTYRIAEFEVNWPEISAFFAKRYRDRIRNRALVLQTGADVEKASSLNEAFDAFWVDEGFLHYGIHATVLSLGGARDVQELITYMPKPDAVVLVEADPETALNNVKSRTRGNMQPDLKADRFVAKNFGTIQDFIHRHELVQTAVQALEGAGVPIIRQTTMGDIDAMAQSTVSQLMALAPNRQHTS